VDGPIAGEIAGELLHVPLFAAEIQLPLEHAAKLRHDRPGTVILKLRDPLRQLRHAGENVQVHADLPLDVGMLDLDRQHLFHRPPQLRLDRRPYLLRRIARHVRLEMLKLIGQIDADQVGPGAEDLAELDERGPQLAQRQTEASLPRMPGNRRAAGRLEQVFGKARPQPADPVCQAVLAQYRKYLSPPP